MKTIYIGKLETGGLYGKWGIARKHKKGKLGARGIKEYRENGKTLKTFHFISKLVN